MSPENDLPLNFPVEEIQVRRSERVVQAGVVMLPDEVAVSASAEEVEATDGAVIVVVPLTGTIKGVGETASVVKVNSFSVGRMASFCRPISLSLWD